MAVAGFVLANLFMIGLSDLGLAKQPQAWAFAVALGLLVFYHFSVLTFYKMDWWQTFCVWFMGLPLT